MDLIHSGSVKVFFGYHWVFGHAVSYKNSLNQSTPVLSLKKLCSNYDILTLLLRFLSLIHDYIKYK